MTMIDRDTALRELALAEFRKERLRQMAPPDRVTGSFAPGEGFSTLNDDAYVHGELAQAAACYAAPPRFRTCLTRLLMAWPWPETWWKPTPHDRLREIVKAGALLVAEYEREVRARMAAPVREDFRRGPAGPKSQAKSGTAPDGDIGRRERDV